MSFWLLCNYAGNMATLADKASATPNIAPGYSVYDLIAGPRSTKCRTDASTTWRRFGYSWSSTSTIFTHCVIARADWMLTQNTTRFVLLQKLTFGGSWSNPSGTNHNPFTSASLMGPTSQDYAFAYTPTEYAGAGIEAIQLGATAEAFQLSKLYFSVGFNFGVEPELKPAPSWEKLTPSNANFFIPQQGFEPYEIEARITIRWLGVSRTKAEAFKALPQLLNWPLFLFDDAQALWSWKLEHVLVESYEETIVEDDCHDISVTFVRLKHYE